MEQVMQQVVPFVTDHPYLSLAWIGLLIMVIYLTFKGKLSKVKEITRTEVVHLINKEDAVVVDIRLHDVFKQGHIAGSYHILPVDIKNNNLGHLEKHKSQPVIVACATGNAAMESANNLVKAGFERVYVLKEGISGWNGENMPLVQGK